VADVATATPPDAPYDRLVSRFGIMFFDDPPAAFSSIVRWLAPGGRFVFAAWASPADNPWQTTVRDVVAEFAELPRSDPEAPGPFRYAGPDKLLALLARAGFAELDVRDWRGSLPVGGALPATEAADFALAAFSSFGELLAAAGDGALAGARSALTERFARHEVDGGVRLDACVHVFTGTRSR
jgi:SAM-dependent methyltransferase